MNELPPIPEQARSVVVSEKIKEVVANVKPDNDKIGLKAYYSLLKGQIVLVARVKTCTRVVDLNFLALQVFRVQQTLQDLCIARLVSHANGVRVAQHYDPIDVCGLWLLWKVYLNVRVLKRHTQ